MYIQTQKHVHIQTHVHTYTDTYTHIHVHTRRHMYRYTHVHTHRHMYNCTCTHRHTHPPSPIKSCDTSLFTHRSGYCTLGGGREHSTHSLLCFHCAQLLSSLTAPSANDRSGLSSETAQQDSPGDTLAPTIISNRHWRAGKWKFQALL
ncbi:unnamed protein product, partial [Staurois parvus]